MFYFFRLLTCQPTPQTCTDCVTHPHKHHHTYPPHHQGCYCHQPIDWIREPSNIMNILWLYSTSPINSHRVCVWGGGATDDVAAATANADSTYTSLITYWQPYEIEMLTRPSAPAWLAGWLDVLPACLPSTETGYYRSFVRSLARSFLRFIYNMKPAISSLVEWNAYGHMECIHQIHLWVQYQYNHHSHLYKKMYIGSYIFNNGYMCIGRNICETLPMQCCAKIYLENWCIYKSGYFWKAIASKKFRLKFRNCLEQIKSTPRLNGRSLNLEIMH